MISGHIEMMLYSSHVAICYYNISFSVKSLLIFIVLVKRILIYYVHDNVLQLHVCRKALNLWGPQRFNKVDLYDKKLIPIEKF